MMSCATAAVLASGLPEPTFLESGSNDLIRFQKGEGPAPPVPLETPVRQVAVAAALLSSP